MKVSTTRFGELEVDKKDIIQFQEGLLGFENLTKFFIVDPGDKTLILWLQSINEPNVAFPILEPKIFDANYVAKLLPAELQSLGLENIQQASIYAILTIPQNIREISANLKAPIVINNVTKTARQIVLQDSKLEVRAPVYLGLKRYIIAAASDGVIPHAPTTQTTSAKRPRPNLTPEL